MLRTVEVGLIADAVKRDVYRGKPFSHRRYGQALKDARRWKRRPWGSRCSASCRKI